MWLAKAYDETTNLYVSWVSILPDKGGEGRSNTHRSTEKRRVLRDGLGSSGCVQNTEQLFQVVLHESVEEDLVLVSQRRKEGMLEDDGRLLLLD